ncbi:hypothetical protein V6U90_31190 [Micromonospora sp. CPCC 206060]|uniref:hypothetical protein n=1 Tax=Micromonospora sp. CPCC 206060 TaxID=3122406 RepID=UPI002FEFA8F3
MPRHARLSGHTPGSPGADGPDLELLSALAAQAPVPVIAEGRYRAAGDIRAAFASGAHSVVIGNPITSPLWITRRLVPAISAGTFIALERKAP